MDSSEKEELERIIDDSFISSFSIISREIARSILALIITIFAGGAAYGIVSAIERTAEFFQKFLFGIFTSLKRTVPRAEEKEQNTIIIFSGLILSLITVIVLICIVFIESIIIENTFVSSTQNLYVMTGILLIFPYTIYVTEILKGYKQIRLANIYLRVLFSWGQVIIVSLFILISITVFNILLGFFTSIIVFFIVGMIFIFYYTPFSLRTRANNVLKEHIFYSTVVIVSSKTQGGYLGVNRKSEISVITRIEDSRTT